MSVRNLDALFAPASIAVIGASNRPGSVGSVVVRNLLRAGFEGPILPVNPRYESVAGILAYPDLRSLPRPVDLGIVCTPAATVPGLIEELVAAGARGAVVFSAGVGDRPQPGHRTGLRTQMLRAARRGTLRVLGPNCLGLLVPGSHLNASFAHLDAAEGRLAFVSQSGAFCTAVLDWARARGIGFSHFVSLGDSADVDLSDLLDHLGSDPRTRAILVYMEATRDARRFLSSARAAARNKPVLVLKAGRMQEGARAAASHTGALAGSDAVYDAALARAGVLRVYEMEELFEAAETLERAAPLRGERLAIVTNGGGPGVTATDALVAELGEPALARLSDTSKERLAALLPETAVPANPLDIIGDAPAERFRGALEVVLQDDGVDGVLVLHAPTALASSVEAARAVAALRAADRSDRNLIAAWLGQETAEPARAVLRGAGIPTFDTPYSAVRAFRHLVLYARNQRALTETPAALPEREAPEREAARTLLAEARRAGRTMLSEPEAKAVLQAYGIPIVATRIVATPAEAQRVAGEMGFPVALKILSPDVTHKSDVGGVALDLEDAAQVEQAAVQMAERLHALRPEARIEGFTVQQMARRAGALELLCGVATDPVFGPVIVFGEGGRDVELIRDRAIGLPPLSSNLARALVEQTRIARRFVPARNRPPVDIDAVVHVVVQLSAMVVDFPEIGELDINPLLADPEGVLALDARIGVASGEVQSRLAIHPYPAELEEVIHLRDGTPLLARPIRPEDEPAHRAFFEKLAPDDVRFRFFGAVRRMPHSQLSRYTQIDYDREMAFIATPLDGPERGATLGVARAVLDSERTRAEFAIVVRSDLKARGLGHSLLEKLIRYCRARGVRELIGQVLPDNRPMLELSQSLGFHARRTSDARIVEVVLKLR